MVQPTSYLYFVSICFLVGYFVRKEFFLLVSPLVVAVVVIFDAIGVKKNAVLVKASGILFVS